MAWKKTDFLIKRRLRQHGLGELVESSLLCAKAEELYPKMFSAVSVKNGVMHIELSKQNQLAFTFIRGKLLGELQTHAKELNIPGIERFRLTIKGE
ncbi:MAG: hypothetical protein K0S20_469 [Patescibacteria group bacterium]|nr:hypothetical protein [Patescibacteria group bacterium]